jgi:hypothetical protein
MNMVIVTNLSVSLYLPPHPLLYHSLIPLTHNTRWTFVNSAINQQCTSHYSSTFKVQTLDLSFQILNFSCGTFVYDIFFLNFGLIFICLIILLIFQCQQTNSLSILLYLMMPQWCFHSFQSPKIHKLMHHFFFIAFYTKCTLNMLCSKTKNNQNQTL